MVSWYAALAEYHYIHRRWPFSRLQAIPTSSQLVAGGCPVARTQGGENVVLPHPERMTCHDNTLGGVACRTANSLHFPGFPQAG